MARSDPSYALPQPDDGLDGAPRDHAEWVAPPALASNLQRYWSAVTSRWWLVAAAIVLAGAGAALYVRSAPKVYTAQADLLVTPIRSSDQALLGLGLISSSTDPTRAALTAAALVKSPEVAQQVRTQLGLHSGTGSLLNAISVAPVGASNVIAISAEASTPTMAKRLADGFGTAVVAQRTARLHRVIAQLLPSLIAGARSLTPDAPLVTEVAELQELRVAPDPTLQVVTAAQTPDSPSSPRPLLSLIVAVLGGGIVGVAGSLILYMADPRLRRVETLRERYRLPILARIATAAGRRSELALARAGAASSASPASFRAIVTMLAASDPGNAPRLVAVSDPSGAPGATFTSINLSRALANAGQQVLLLDADVTDPGVGHALGQTPRYGLQEVIADEVALQDALLDWGSGVQLLLPSALDDPYARDMLTPAETGRLLESAAELADWVVVCLPPVGDSIEALPYARAAGHMLLVVRLGTTLLADLERAASALVQNEVTPTGFVVLDT